MKGKIKSYIIAIIIPLVVGGLSALFTMGNMNIYDELKTPPLSPPGILFPIVWTVLYILMGVSSGIIYNAENATPISKNSSLYTYAQSLFFNFFWSIFFFNLRAFLFSLFWLLVLLFLIVRTIMKYYKINKTAAFLQIPYLIWVTFAGYLNFGIWWLNR